jgi:hypothetical protein
MLVVLWLNRRCTHRGNLYPQIYIMIGFQFQCEFYLSYNVVVKVVVPFSMLQSSNRLTLSRMDVGSQEIERISNQIAEISRNTLLYKPAQ